MANIFISYVRENKDVVDKLAKDLESYNIKVWIDRNEINPGVLWKTAIRRAISRGDFFVACFSLEYNSRVVTYMNEELTLAIDELRKRPTDRAWFIPVLLSGTIPDREISATSALSDIQAISINEANWRNGIERIVHVINPEAKMLGERVQQLISLLSSKKESDRMYAAGELGDIRQKEVVPALIGLLSDSSIDVRRAAVEGIEQIGRIAEEAVPALVKLLKSESEASAFLCDSLATALASIGESAIPYLLDSLEDENMILRLNAARALGLIGARSGDKIILTRLIVMTEDKAVAVREVAVQALEKFGADSALIIPTLAKTIRDEAAHVRYMSARILSRLGPEIKSTMQSIIEGLSDPDPGTRCECMKCIESLANSDIYSQDAILILMKMENKGLYYVRQAASRTLKTINERQKNRG